MTSKVAAHRKLVALASGMLTLLLGACGSSAATKTLNDYKATSTTAIVQVATTVATRPSVVSTTVRPTTTSSTAPPTTATTAQTLSNGNTYTNVDGNTVHSPAYTSDGQPPLGATARCGDGTYSFSQHHSGTCSHHGGVAQWL